jgi:hypothetical protein
VLTLILVLLLVWFVLTVVLAAWTLWFQGYIYSEPVGEIYWRAPAAGTALALFLCLWAVLDYRVPGRYRALFEFSGREGHNYDELYIPAGPGGTAGDTEEVYRFRPSAQGGRKYYKGDKLLPSRPGKVIVLAKDQRHVFEPDRDAAGNFVVSGDGWLHYRDKARGLEMVEGQLGQVSVYHTGWLIVDLLLNLVHLALWWVCLWLVLRFQWPHALGMAVVSWGAMTLFVVPMVLGRAEVAARQRAAPPSPPAAVRLPAFHTRPKYL